MHFNLTPYLGRFVRMGVRGKNEGVSIKGKKREWREKGRKGDLVYECWMHSTRTLGDLPARASVARQENSERGQERKRETKLNPESFC